MAKQIEAEGTMDVGWWDEQECRMPSKKRLKRERQAYEEAEREGLENG